MHVFLKFNIRKNKEKNIKWTQKYMHVKRGYKLTIIHNIIHPLRDFKKNEDESKNMLLVCKKLTVIV
jgi:hypothetical protein